jgi:hypothetical protein
MVEAQKARRVAGKSVEDHMEAVRRSRGRAGYTLGVVVYGIGRYERLIRGMFQIG